MKRNFYIFFCIVFGILLTTLIHGLIEIWYINLLLTDFATYGFGWSWNTWFMIHNIGATLLWLGGAWIGWKLGPYWWDIVYIKKKHWFRKK